MTENIGFRTPRLHGFFADGDLSAKQYHFVKIGTKKNTVAPITATTDKPVGILMEFSRDGTDGDRVSVALLGGGGMLAMAGAVAPGAPIKTDNAGKGVLADTDGDRVAATADAYGSNSASGDTVAVDLAQYDLYVAP